MNSKYFFLTNQLNEAETRVVTSIVNHIENGEERMGIAKIAAENYVSTAFIIKMCKKLGYNGYTDLVYKLSQQKEISPTRNAYELKTLIDDYNEEHVKKFISYLRQFHDRKMFAVGAGFADIVAEYIAQRLAVCGFMVFNRVHFYDYMLFRNSNAQAMQTNVEPAVIIAISQSGETDIVLNDVVRARQNDFRVVSFTKMRNSTLAGMSDLTFIIDGTREALISTQPNSFFGKVILAFDEMLGIYFLEEQNG
jgi:DNA-binding MurR/RpiR family transcriptional regulator